MTIVFKKMAIYITIWYIMKNEMWNKKKFMKKNALLSVSLSVYLPVHLSVCLFIYHLCIHISGIYSNIYTFRKTSTRSYFFRLIVILTSFHQVLAFHHSTLNGTFKKSLYSKYKSTLMYFYCKEIFWRWHSILNDEKPTLGK